MKQVTPEISWHGRDPIYSVDFQFIKDDIQRLATCGTDRHVRIWEVNYNENGQATVEFLSSLTRHTKTVNVVRFSPCGQMLASAGDDSAILIWKLNESAPPPNNIFADDEKDNKETWNVLKVLRSHLEDVYDLSWSQDGKHLISGSVDNSAIYWDVKKGVRLGMFPDHKSFVQGVAFDPQNQFLATMSADRACRIYSIETKNCLHVVSKVQHPSNNNKNDQKVVKMFHDDTMKSFFRRLSFTPDGTFLITPAGCIDNGNGEPVTNACFIFTRACLTKPVVQLPVLKTATLAVRCCPILFELRKVPRVSPVSNTEQNIKSNDSKTEDNQTDQEWKQYETLFSLPYRMVYAVATEDSVLFYDTQQTIPFAMVSNIHYHTLSDLSWSPDGRTLAVSSTDGYITFVTFSEGELGIPYKEQVVHINSRADLKRKDEDRQRELEKKKRAKEEDKLARKAGKLDMNGDKKEEVPPAAAVSITQTEKSEASTSFITNASQNSTNTSVPAPQKKPRRVAITTLTSVPPPSSPSSNSSSRLSASDDTTSNTPNKTSSQVSSSIPSNNSQPASCKVNGEVSQSPKTPRRVGITTLTRYESPSTSSSKDTPSLSQNDSCFGMTPKRDKLSEPTTPTSSRSERGKKPKRVQVTTLSTFGQTTSDSMQCETTDNTSQPGVDSDLHLVMETTCDNTSLVTPSACDKDSKELPKSVLKSQDISNKSQGTEKDLR